MNNNLNSIESAFLAQDNINSALCLTEIKSGLTKTANAQKKKFELSIALSKHVVTAYEWIKSDDGKSAMAEQGLSWTMDDFALKVFGWQKSYMHKMRKVGAMTEMFTDAFKRRAKIDINFTTSVASIIKFADVVDLSEMVNGETETEIDTEVALQLERAQAEASESETETETETDGETESETETETDGESDTIAMINIASIVGSEAIVCRIDRSINVHSHNSKEDVLSALDRLKSMVEQYML